MHIYEKISYLWKMDSISYWLDSRGNSVEENKTTKLEP
jgi:hypothetical protein